MRILDRCLAILIVIPVLNIPVLNIPALNSLVADEVADAASDSDVLALAECHDCCQCAHAVPSCNCVNRNPGHPAKPKREKPGDRNWSDCLPHRYRMCDWDRAGDPHQVGGWAKCSVDRHYSGSYVGGGAALKGRPRMKQEGTWGLDYHGLFEPAKFFLRWTCGREQGGEGAYETDREPACHDQLKRQCE